MAISVHILFIIGIFSPSIIQLIARIHTCRLYPLSIAYVLPHYHCLCHHLSFAFIYALHFIFVTLFPIYFVLSRFFRYSVIIYSHIQAMAIKCALIAEKSILKTLKRVRNTSAEVSTVWARKLHSTMINYGERNKTMRQFIFFIVFFPNFTEAEFVWIHTIHTQNTYRDDICRLLEWKRFTDRYVRCTNRRQRTWKKSKYKPNIFVCRVCVPPCTIVAACFGFPKHTFLSLYMHSIHYPKR